MSTRDFFEKYRTHHKHKNGSVNIQLVTQWSHWTQFSHIQIGLIRTKSTDSPRKIWSEASRFSKASWDKMIVEIIGGNGSMIYLVVLVVWYDLQLLCRTVLKSVYIGRDKVTVANHFYFVSVGHK